MAEDNKDDISAEAQALADEWAAALSEAFGSRLTDVSSQAERIKKLS